MYDAQIEMSSQIVLAVLRRLKWLFLLILYLGILSVFGFKGLLILSLILVPSVLAYVMDKEREAQGQDDFTGSGLFYRYGEQIHDLTLSLPVQPEWDEQQTMDFAQSLQAKLAQRIRRYLPERLAQIQDSRRLANTSTRETKDFIRVIARSRQGSVLAHFVHLGTYGEHDHGTLLHLRSRLLQRLRRVQVHCRGAADNVVLGHPLVAQQV